MSRIPEDIRRVAVDVVCAIPDGTEVNNITYLVKLVSRAILAERQRCADVAYAAAEDAYYGPYERFAHRIKFAVLVGGDV